jgi:dolichyl-phosphate beta-glucosyltransferase
VIPSYNQRSRTRAAATEALTYLRGLLGEHAELIVVDDGSDSGAGVQASDLPPEVVFIGLPRNLGKGGALRAGVERARGEYVIFTDSDLPFSLDAIPTTLALLRDGADLVIGDRSLPESEFQIHVRPIRRLSTLVFNFMVKHFCALHLDDTQCGYKGYRGPVAKALFSRLETRSFAFDVELLLRAQKAGYCLRRQALRMVHNEDSSVRLSRHAPGMFVDMLRIAARNVVGRYE